MRFGEGVRDKRLSLFSLILHSAAALIESLTDIGYAELPAGALDQAHTQPLFQRGNSTAELRLGLTQGPPRGSEPAMGYNFSEIGQIIQVASHESFSIWNDV